MTRNERRILAMESALAPRPPALILLDAGEGPDFVRKVAEARAAAVRVIVVVADESAGARLVDGAEHMGRTAAALTWLSCQPSIAGRRDALSDLIQSVQGKSSIGPARRTTSS